jgi:vanillate O-demethylase monooxygenase subunit
MGMLWVWMGDPELADTSKVFDLPEYHSPEWSAVEGDALLIKADYLNLADNLCDPAHVNFVHLSTLGNASGENIPVYFEEEERKVLTWRWILDAPAIPVFAKHGSFKGNVDRWHYYHYYAPSLAIIDFGSADTGTGAPEGKLDNCIRMFACHFIRPVDAHTSVDHWLHVKNFQATDAQNKELSDDFRVAFAEDKAILEAIDENEQRYPGRRPVRIAIDAAPQRMRRMVDRMIQAEAITQ